MVGRPGPAQPRVGLPASAHDKPWLLLLECLRKYVYNKMTCLLLKEYLPSHQVFGVFALEVNKILQATPSKLRREMGMCATAIYVQLQQ